VIANPIIRKEVLSALRTRKAAIMQTTFFVVLAGLFWLLWPADGLQDVGGETARQIFSIVAIGQLVMVTMFAPAFTAASLTLERERNTLESLYTTALRPWEIALGKMAGSLTFLMLLVLTGLPALMLPTILGGISLREVLAAWGILLLTALYLGMMGLLVSVFMQRSYRAIIVAYVVVAAVTFVAALPAWPVSGYLIGRAGTFGQTILHVIASLSPLEAMISLVWKSGPEGSAYAQGAQHMPPFWAVFLPLSLLLCAVTTVACLVRLRHATAPSSGKGSKSVVERGLSARNLLFLVDPRKRKRNIAWWQNPVLMKEFRTRPTLHAQWLIRAVCTALIVSVLLMLLVGISIGFFVGEQRSGEGHDMFSIMATTVGVLTVVLVLLLGPAMTGGAISGDRESGVWDQVRATRLGSCQIVIGKFLASIIPLLLLALATAPSLGVLLYFRSNLYPNLLRIAAVVGMTIVFVSTAGMFFSSLFSRSSTATAWTYGLVISLGLTTLLMLLGREQFSERLVGTIFIVNPVAAVIDAAGVEIAKKHSDADAVAAGVGIAKSYSFFIPHLKVIGGASVALFVAAVARTFHLLRAD